MPLRGVNGRSLLRLLPFAFSRRQEKKAGEETHGGVPAAAPALAAALAVAGSCIVHLAFLIPAFTFGGNPFDTPPRADVVTVELVPADDAARTTAAPPPGETPPTEDTPARDTPGQDTPANPPPADSPAKDAPAKDTPTNITPAKDTLAEPPPPSAEPAAPQSAAVVTPSVLPPPPLVAPPSQTPAEPPQHPEAGEANAAGIFGMPMTMPDGTVGGRTLDPTADHPAVDQADVTGDVAAAFFSHLKTCATRPADLPPGVRVMLRLYLKPDGTLATDVPANPQPLKVSMGGGELFMSAVAALKKCQPYTMLPPDRYSEWRTLDLTFTPQNF